MMDRTNYLLGLVNERMERLTCTPGDGRSAVAAAVSHHLRAGGGRIRALICLDASQRLGLTDDTSVVLATACELIHNASLVQDDVFDREATRRGVESVWKLFGDTVAICTGDLFLSAAFAALAELPDPRLISPLLDLVFLHTRSVIVGQGSEKDAVPVTLADYEAIAISKSASLLTLPLHLPLMASGNASSMTLAQRVTEPFAVAYQIADDCEDYQQDRRVGALNVLAVLCGRNALDLDQARALATARAVQLLHRCIGEAVELPLDCSAVIVSHASRMLADIEAKATHVHTVAQRLQYVG